MLGVCFLDFVRPVSAVLNCRLGSGPGVDPAEPGDSATVNT
jgi:hypothetical protein